MYGAEPFPKISTGTDVVVASNRMVTTTGSGSSVSGVQPMSPMDTIREVFFEIRDSLTSIAENTLKTANLLEKSAPTSAEIRDDKINAGETDTQGNPPPADEGGPGFLDRLSNLNPFKGGLGTFGKFLVAIGALVGLQLFGDKLIPSLAKFLETIKTGKLGEKIESIYIDLKEGAMEAFEDIKFYTGKFIEGAKSVMGIIKGAYTMVNDYIMQFDTKGTRTMHPTEGVIETGDGIIDEQEMGNLKEDLRDKAFDIIGDFFSDLLLAFGGALLASTFITKAAPLLLAHPAIKNIFSFGKPFQGPMLPGAGAVGMSATAATLGIGALLLYGVTTTYKNINDSLAKTLEENNNEFKTSSFFGNFFGGNDEGGVLNALKQAFLVGGTGTLAGLGIAGTMAAAGATFGPPGIIAGGLIGLAIGGIIGVMSGLTGSEKLEKMFKKFGEKVSGTIDMMNGFFDGILDNIRSFFTGSTTKYETDEGAMTEDLAKLIQDKKDAEKVAAGKYATAYQKKQPAEIQKKIDKLMGKIENVDEAKAKYEEEEAFRAVRGLTDRIGEDSTFGLGLKSDLARKTKRYNEAMGDNLFGIVNEKRAAKLKKEMKETADKIYELELRKQKELQELGVDYQIPLIKSGDTLNFDPRYNKIPSMNNGMSPGHPSNMIANNNNQLSQNIKTETHSHGGLSSGDNFYTAVVAANKFGKMQTTN